MGLVHHTNMIEKHPAKFAMGIVREMLFKSEVPPVPYQMNILCLGKGFMNIGPMR